MWSACLSVFAVLALAGARIRPVPVSTNLSAERTRWPAGSELSLPCEVDGYPLPEVYWTKDGVPLTANSRMQITDARLTISGVTEADNGVYGCHAANAYSSHYSTVQITVEGVTIPPECIDNPFFANCKLIIRNKLCNHTYYSKFCCKSCVEAGLLQVGDVLMQGDQPWTAYTSKK